MNSFKVKIAEIEDLNELQYLFDQYRCFYGKPSDLDLAKSFLADRINNRESIIFIANDGERMVGFTQLYPSFSSVSAARIFILNDLYVDIQSRRKNIATGLLNAAKDYAKSRNAIRMSLSTATNNNSAQKLYESLGWIKDEQFFHYNLSTL